MVGFKRGFGTFFLDATDHAGHPVQHLPAPATVRVRYTPEQLQALGIAEHDLTLFSYEESAREWQALATEVDPASHTATAEVRGSGPYQLSDGSSPSAAFIPSLGAVALAKARHARHWKHPVQRATASSVKAFGSRCLGSISRPSS